MRRFNRLSWLGLLLCGCAGDPVPFTEEPLDAAAGDDASGKVDAVTPVDDLVAVTDTVFTADVPPVTRDVSAPRDINFAEDATCTSVSANAQIERQPVDIIWMVDNSTSMAPAIDQVIMGLNNFAQVIGQRGLDYRVVMLSLRNMTRNVTVNGGRRYAVCIPQPLAGDARCGNGPRFRHASIDIRSTQPLEQMLGSLAQTTGYTADDDRGGEVWRDFLRAGASKTFVVVTDDNSRFSATQFETFRGGQNPFTSTLRLPPGVLDPSWNGLFANYTFAGIYGWGSETNPDTRCTYTGTTTQPSAAGTVYTQLIARSNGVRARICDGATAWGPFFNAIATAVDRASRIECDLAIPRPPDGSVLDPRRVNVSFSGSVNTRLGRVLGATACGPAGGWHYDNEQSPTRVVLCPASCQSAQELVRTGDTTVTVQFGCLSVPG